MSIRFDLKTGCDTYHPIKATNQLSKSSSFSLVYLYLDNSLQVIYDNSLDM
jgi:hypothetical protein